MFKKFRSRVQVVKNVSPLLHFLPDHKLFHGFKLLSIIIEHFELFVNLFYKEWSSIKAIQKHIENQNIIILTQLY